MRVDSGHSLHLVTPYIQQTNLGYFEAIKAEKGIGRMPGGAQ